MAARTPVLETTIDDVKKIDALRSKINDIKLLVAKREANLEELQQNLKVLRKKIKDEFDVEPEDLENLVKEYDKKLNDITLIIEKNIDEVKEKMNLK